MIQFSKMSILLLLAALGNAFAQSVGPSTESPRQMEYCPRAKVFGHCSHFCMEDTSCDVGQKCCSNGCGMDCVKSCTSLQCASCPPGFMRAEDDRGCKTCECTDCTKPSKDCDKLCQHGYETGKDGCATCKCQDEPKCKLSRCPFPCPNGYQVNKKGCKTCMCRPRAPCPPIGRCGPECKLGRSMLGCSVCDCSSPPRPKGKTCPELRCYFPCPNGNMLDRNGCKTCRCRSRAPCPPLTNCPKECKRQQNMLGCPLCVCQAPCPEFTCAKKCLHGFKKDADNCDICECKQPPMPCFPLQPCPPGCMFKKNKQGCFYCVCPYTCTVRSCPNDCDSYKTDKNGCLTCNCH